MSRTLRRRVTGVVRRSGKAGGFGLGPIAQAAGDRATGASHRVGDLIADRYLVKAVLGEGPAGFVFRCTDRQLNVEVACKVVHARLVQTDDDRVEFSQSLHRATKVVHANVAKVHDEGLDGARPYFSAQFLDGQPLRKIIDARLAKKQVFTPAEVEPILSQLASGLDAIHRHSPHGAVKPENVIVLPELLKLTDLGLGVGLPRLPYLLAQKSRRSDRYFAPEFAQNGPLTAAVDVYALGAIVGELLAGVLPDGGIPELLRAQPSLPPALEGVYRKALSPAPRSRFKTAGELHQAFAEALAKKPPASASAAPKAREPLAPPVPDDTLPRAKNPMMPATAASETVTMSREELASDPGPVDDEENSTPSVVVEKSALEEDPATREEVRPPRREELPVDATRPMDAADLSLITNAVKLDDATIAMSQSGLPAFDLAAPRGKPRLAGLDRTWVWLGALTVVGLALGALGGALILRAARAPSSPTTSSSATIAARPPARLDPADRSTAVLLPPSAPAPAPAPAKNPVRSASATAPQSCPDGMVFVPAGAFKMGTADDDPMMGFDERKLGPVMQGAYCVDAFEYPNRKGARPQAAVSWAEAKGLCEREQKRLCTEPEWEKACKGPASARFPYGQGFDVNACNTEGPNGADRSARRVGAVRALPLGLRAVRSLRQPLGVDRLGDGQRPGAEGRLVRAARLRRPLLRPEERLDRLALGRGRLPLLRRPSLRG